MSKRARDAKKAAEEQELQEKEAAEQAAPQLTASRAKKPVKPKAPPLTGPQKAAAVIVSLGVDKASQIYKYMDSDDVETLTLEVARLGYLDAEQTEEVLGDFYGRCLTNKAVTEGGLEYARTVLEKAFGEQAAGNFLEKVTNSLKNRQFAFLDKADAKSLFSSLQYERPQTIALVLSYVPPDKAANVVEQLDPKRQIKVVENIARM